MINFGISDFDTYQQLLTFHHVASKYSPDMALLASVVRNDVRDNSRWLEPNKNRPFTYLIDEDIAADTAFTESLEFKRRTCFGYYWFSKPQGFRMAQVISYARAAALSSGEDFAGSTRATGFEAGLNDFVFNEPREAERLEAWQITESIISQLSENVADAGAGLMIANLPSGIQIHPNVGARKNYADRIRGLSEDLNIDHLIMPPEMLNIAETSDQ